MQRFKLFAASTTVFLLPVAFASAQLADVGVGATGGTFGLLLKTILTFTNTVLIPFIIGIGFLVFVWGMFQYFIAGGANDEAKEKGKSLMIWAVVAFVMITIFWGVINLLVQSLGLSDASISNPGSKNVIIP